MASPRTGSGRASDALGASRQNVSAHAEASERTLECPAMRSIELEAEISAPRDKVWELYTDHEAWPRWAGVKEVVVRSQGDPPPNGLGTARVVRAGGLAIEEETVCWDPPKRLGYRIVAGAPLKNHEAEVLLEPTPTGTKLRYKARFDPRIPLTGALVESITRRSIRDLLDRIQRQFT